MTQLPPPPPGSEPFAAPAPYQQPTRSLQTPPAPPPIPPPYQPPAPQPGSQVPYRTQGMPPPPYQPVPAASYPPGAGTGQQPVSQLTRIIGWILAGLGSVVFISAFLPWVSVLGLSVAGVADGQGDGILTLLLSLPVIGLGVVRGAIGRVSGWSLAAAITAVVCGGLTALIALVDTVRIADTIGSPGAGLILTLFGGGALVGVGVWGLIQRD